MSGYSQELSETLWKEHGLVTHGSVAKAVALGIDPNSLSPPPRDIDVFGTEAAPDHMGTLAVDSAACQYIQFSKLGVALIRDGVIVEYKIDPQILVNCDTRVATPSGVALVESISNLYVNPAMEGLRIKRLRLDLRFIASCYAGGLVAPEVISMVRDFRYAHSNSKPHARYVEWLRFCSKPMPYGLKNRGMRVKLMG